jgi:uncharacterized protein (DUF952 family)
MSTLNGIPAGMPDQTGTLYHMLPEEDWLRAVIEQRYEPASLEEEGFIHLSPSPQVALQVANHFYANEPGAWVVLLLNSDAIVAPVQWDPVGETFFPHIYGPLNLDAVREVIPFPRDESGAFLPLPE